MTVIAEGKRTEPDYIRTFARLHGAGNVDIEVEGIGADPMSLVKRAATLRKQRHRSRYGQKDTIWVVFDRDQHPRFEEAKQCAHDNGIKLAVSNPCFELWAVFHYQDQGGHIDRHACQRLLEQLCGTYRADRGKRFGDERVIVEGYQAAVTRAKQSLKRRGQEEPGRKPLHFHALFDGAHS